MATAQTLIDRALRLILQLDSGVSATTQESTDALTALNAMIESWRNERLMCFALRDESAALVANQSTYTVGSGGDFDTDRAVDITSAYIVASTISHDLDIITAEQYDAIPQKTATSSWPDRIYYQRSYPLGTIYTYPVSNGTSATLHIRTRTPVLAFTATTDSVSLPPGWEKALATNLAIELAPEYNTTADPQVLKMAVESKAALKQMNSRPTEAWTELPLLVGNVRRGTILTGDL